MQSQLFVIERLNNDRRADLYLASMQAHQSPFAGRTIVGRSVARVKTMLRVRRPGLQSQPGASNAHPVASR